MCTNTGLQYNGVHYTLHIQLCTVAGVTAVFTQQLLVVVTCHTHSPEERVVGGEDGGGVSGGEGGSSVTALSFSASTKD